MHMYSFLPYLSLAPRVPLFLSGTPVISAHSHIDTESCILFLICHSFFLSAENPIYVKFLSHKFLSNFFFLWYVCTYVCVCSCACMYGCSYVHTYVRICTYVCCLYLCHVCMCVCLYVCMYVCFFLFQCMHLCSYVCMSLRTCVSVRASCQAW